ncbi:hypothetical protein GCM10010415_64840 [Streptomyces atrovirens]|uniref:Uncharacterized protein n=1 Tax=Streptomyces atrovirens TaxID=285556 RepID=A0ABW0DNB9_9ACTN
MSIRELSRPAGAALADLVEQSAVLELAIQQEAPRSDAPLHAPQALDQFLLLLSPKEPTEPKKPKKV